MGARKIRDIEYHLLGGSERSTTDIVIERDGTICVRPPITMTPEQVDSIIENKRMWIYKNLAEWRELNAMRTVREWKSGESFLYLGRNYRLGFNDTQNTPLVFKENRFYLNRSLIENDGEIALRNAFIEFYIQKGIERLQKRVTYFAPKVGVQSGKISVKELGFRWASCSSNGNIAFHWKCMMAPPKIIDYIIVHELCHLHQRDHNVAFWNEVDKVMPDYIERKEWLRINGASLDL
jgi:predicted metal-dependent hydrolase